MAGVSTFMLTSIMMTAGRNARTTVEERAAERGAGDGATSAAAAAAALALALAALVFLQSVFVGSRSGGGAGHDLWRGEFDMYTAKLLSQPSIVARVLYLWSNHAHGTPVPYLFMQ